MTIVSESGNNVELTGTIVGFISGGFSVQAGKGVGYLHILTNASTVITGPALSVGENVDVVGTGSVVAGTITATSVRPLVLTATPSPTPLPSATPIVTATPGPTPTPASTQITVPVGVTFRSGPIVAVNSAYISISAGHGCGYMHIMVNAATMYLNGAPKVGEYGAFTGVGATCSSFTAQTVLLSASAFSSANYTGTVSAQTPYGFLLAAGPSASAPVVLSSSTVVFGAALTVGSSVTVTAQGVPDAGLEATQVAVASAPTPTPNPATTPTPAPTPIAQTHVLTFAYIYGYAGVPTTIPLYRLAPYVTWTQTDEPHAAMIRAAGIKVQAYVNFWRNYAGDNPNVGYQDLKPGGAHAAAEAKDCSGNVIFDSSYSGGYEADARTADALPHAQLVTNYRLGSFGGNYDALFSDDSGAVDGIKAPCNYTESAYDSAVDSVHTSLQVPMFINALGAAPNPAAAVDLLAPANVLGAMCEICYGGNTSTGDVIHTGNRWIDIENAEIGTIAQHKTFWAYARLIGDASQETSMRTYVYASFLLSYAQGHAMFQEALQTPSGLPVMPETGLVPTAPVTTASDVSGYLAAGGAYFREFARCYYRGTFVDRCAVAVNPGTTTVPVPSTSYNHSLTLSGYGVLDGGTVGFTGGAVSALSPGTAAILFP